MTRHDILFNFTYGKLFPCVVQNGLVSIFIVLILMFRILRITFCVGWETRVQFSASKEFFSNMQLKLNYQLLAV